jgi:transcriptional regulator with XRE-family HTH domain
MINRALYFIRDFHGLAQSELASRLGISNSYLSEIENSKKDVSLDLLRKYEELFGIPVSSIMLFSEQLAHQGSSEKIRFSAARKITRLLDWLSERDKISA